jgi:hypothetical protein
MRRGRALVTPNLSGDRHEGKSRSFKKKTWFQFTSD